MANTKYLKEVVEPHIIGWMSKKLNLGLKPMRLKVGRRMDGQAVHFEFDGVSTDHDIAVLVSASLSNAIGVIRKLHVDASILLQAPLKRRLMVFVSNDVKQTFINKCDGLLPLGKIEFYVCDRLPNEMKVEMAKIQDAARTEVGHKGKPRKLPGPRR